MKHRTQHFNSEYEEMFIQNMKTYQLYPFLLEVENKAFL